MSFPSFEEFNALPKSHISAHVPETVIYNVSGSRRAAALIGKPTAGDGYLIWSHRQMIRCLKILFDHGVKNVLMPAVTPGLFKETTENYREHLWRWIDWGFASDETLAEFQELNWNVRIIFSEFIPELGHTHERLNQIEMKEGRPNLWVSVASSHNQMMEWMLQKIQLHGPVANTTDAIKLLYGADIPPAKLFLDFGKPIVSSDVVPPFLTGIMNCYWSQQPGYSLTCESFRKILYDYLYVRKTWQSDKSDRTVNVLNDKDQWEQLKIIGLGKKLGPYWYPID